MWFTDKEINLIDNIIVVVITMKMKMVMNTSSSMLIQTSSFHEEASRRFEFGGTTSIRVKGELFQPIIIFGQDESAFHQYLLKSKNWRGPKGGNALLPKSDGIAVMAST
jgi:hypothetical protein